MYQHACVRACVPACLCVCLCVRVLVSQLRLNARSERACGSMVFDWLWRGHSITRSNVSLLFCPAIQWVPCRKYYCSLCWASLTRLSVNGTVPVEGVCLVCVLILGFFSFSIFFFFFVPTCLTSPFSCFPKVLCRVMHSRKFRFPLVGIFL